MAARKQRHLTQAEQSARFLAAARKSEADKTGKKFERAFKKIVPRQKPKQ